MMNSVLFENKIPRLKTGVFLRPATFKRNVSGRLILNILFISKQNYAHKVQLSIFRCLKYKELAYL